MSLMVTPHTTVTTMRLDTNYKVLSHVPYAALKEFMLNAPTELWDANVNRARLFNVHKETSSIVFKFTDLNDITNCHTYDAWGIAGEALTDVVDDVVGFYRNAEAVRVIAPMLPPGCRVLPHEDGASTFAFTHRVHVPLLLNPKVRFIVNGEDVPMEEGLAIEINNLETHEVINNGETPRIHLIIDVLESYE